MNYDSLVWIVMKYNLNDKNFCQNKNWRIMTHPMEFQLRNFDCKNLTDFLHVKSQFLSSFFQTKDLRLFRIPKPNFYSDFPSKHRVIEEE